MQIVPQRLFGLPHVRHWRVKDLGAIVHKSLSSPLQGQLSYLSCHAVALVLKGVQEISTYEGDLVQNGPGDVLFLPRGLYTISDLLPENQQFEALVFYFPIHLIESWQADEQPAQADVDPPPFLHFPRAAHLQHFAESLTHLLLTHDTPDPALTELKLQELLHLLALQLGKNRLSGFLTAHARGKSRNLRQFMEANFDRPLQVVDYAYLCGRSLSSFRRDFKRHFDATPVHWLRQRRLEKARLLLENHAHSVTDAAQAVGYQNVSYFIREFRKAYAQTPSAYLKTRRKA
ncbi:MAG: AraC family transcriptional regulator [Bacteroidota bacterium]